MICFLRNLTVHLGARKILTQIRINASHIARSNENAQKETLNEVTLSTTKACREMWPKNKNHQILKPGLKLISYN